MTLEGAINFNETENYIIYTMNSSTTGQYGVVMPKNITGTLNMLVDLHMKGSFDSVGSGAKTKEQLVSEISEEYNKLKTKYADGMLVIPMIDEGMFQNAVVNSDKQKMFDEVKKIGAITSELYKKLTDSGVEKQKIDQKIIIVEKNQDDEKFVVWLKEQMPNFVDGIRYSELVTTQDVVNPFVDSNSIFGPVAPAPKEEPVAPSAPVSAPSIFDTPAPVAPVAPVVPVVAPVVEQPSPVVAEQATSVVPEQQANNSANNVDAGVDIFGIPMSVQGVTDNVSSVQQSSSATEPVVAAPVAPEPKPVESASLEGTTTFNPIPTPVPSNTENNSVVNQEDNSEGGSAVEHASKGFANLIILVVILIGVTIASIELGKYLYSVYGA